MESWLIKHIDWCVLRRESTEEKRISSKDRRAGDNGDAKSLGSLGKEPGCEMRTRGLEVSRAKSLEEGAGPGPH